MLFRRLHHEIRPLFTMISLFPYWLKFLKAQRFIMDIGAFGVDYVGATQPVVVMFGFLGLLYVSCVIFLIVFHFGVWE